MQPSATAAAERAEREVASRYESKLGEIEAAMRELVGQNRTLKDELRRWTSEGTDFAPYTSGVTVAHAAAHARRATPTTAGGGLGGVRGGTGVRGSGIATAEFGMARTGLAPHEGDTPLRPMWAWGGDGAAAGDGGPGGGLGGGDEGDEAEFEEAPTGGMHSGRSGEMHSADRAMRRLHTDRRPGTAPPEAGASSSGEGSRARARAKLDEAKSSLQLAGSAAPMGSAAARGAPQTTDRATASQTKARLQDIQRKRAELIRKRHMVRNYNDLKEAE